MGGPWLSFECKFQPQPLGLLAYLILRGKSFENPKSSCENQNKRRERRWRGSRYIYSYSSLSYSLSDHLFTW